MSDCVLGVLLKERGAEAGTESSSLRNQATSPGRESREDQEQSLGPEDKGPGVTRANKAHWEAKVHPKDSATWS